MDDEEIGGSKDMIPEVTKNTIDYVFASLKELILELPPIIISGLDTPSQNEIEIMIKPEKE